MHVSKIETKQNNSNESPTFSFEVMVKVGQMLFQFLQGVKL